MSGSVEEFVNLMNKKVKALELKNTHFVTPHGLDNDNHYTTAYELAILTDYALNNDTFVKIVNTKSHTISINGVNRTISNTNELLGNLNGVDGVKTGFTGNAMRCLVTSCTREGHQIITVVLGADTKKYRTQDSVKLIEYTFSNYKWIDLKELVIEEFNSWKTVNQNRIKVEKAKDNNLDLELKEQVLKFVPVKNNTEDNVIVDIDCISSIEAPIEKNTKVGNIRIRYNDEVLETIDIVTSRTMQKKCVLDYMFEFFEILPSCIDFYA